MRLFTRKCPFRFSPGVGGERPPSVLAGDVEAGSAPRGRGTGADQTECSACRFSPRVGGERDVDVFLDRCRIGSAPRGRGTGRRLDRSRRKVRFSPAWAGTAAPWRWGRAHGEFSPARGTGALAAGATAGVWFSPAGGERRAAVAILRLGSRFSPAWGGERRSFRMVAVRVTGSAPRGRGTERCRRPTCRIKRHGRFSPAWAGNGRRPCLRSLGDVGSAPRGRERKFRVLSDTHRCGSAPRGRGTVLAKLVDQLYLRFSPAWGTGNGVPGKPA